MSMIELGFLLLCAVLAILGWIIGSHLRAEWYYCALAAVVGGFIPAIVTTLMQRHDTRRMKKRPPYPVCEHGTCTWDDYHAVNSRGEDVEFMCKCGKRYLKTGQQFLKLLDDGRTLPYKRLGTGHQWEDDM